ncbi:MAG: hypothetical protein AAF431_17585 [Pseudomonadota bacterium]
MKSSHAIIGLCAFTIAASTTPSLAGPYTASKDKACPDAWALTNKTIPVIASTTDPWGVATNDKDLARTHLSSVSPIETVKMLPVTDDDLVDDLLTVASECLVYRNYELDTWDYVPPEPITPNTVTGWIPAAVF